MYYITILLLFTFSVIEMNYDLSTRRKQKFIYFSFLILFLQTGLRWETGTDWNPYLNNFLLSDSIVVVLANVLIGFELGYGLLVYAVRLITDDYTVFLLIHAFIYLFLIFKSIKKLYSFTFLPLLIFYVLTIGLLGSNRQLIAVALCLYSLSFALERKKLKFFTIILIAFLFHSSAILFGIYYFLNKKIKPIYIFSILILSFIVGKTNIPLLLFSEIGNLLGGASLNKIDNYSDKDALGDFSLSIIGLVRRIIYLVLFLSYYSMLSKKVKNFNIFFNGFLVGLVFYLLFSDSLLILVNRGSIYFNIMEIFLISSLINLFKDRRSKNIFIVFLLLYSFYLFHQSISVYSDLFIPYKGIFINQDLNRTLY